MYTCREPGCIQGPYEQRKSRNAHEDSAHAGSPARVWVCPHTDCGEAGAKYDPEGLRGHMQRSHQMTREEIDADWPEIERRRAELLGQPMEAPEEDPAPPVDVVAKQIAALLRDWDETRAALARAEEYNGELSRQLDEVTTERNQLQERCQRVLAVLQGESGETS